MGRDGTSLPDAVTWAKSVSSELRKPLFDETFKANEVRRKPAARPRATGHSKLLLLHGCHISSVRHTN